MLIVCTQDQDIVNYTQIPGSGADNWGTLSVIPQSVNQQQATTAIANAISEIGPTEPLCFSAHGSNDVIGDAGSGAGTWTWTHAAIAALLHANAPANYAGPILVHACATSVANFSANLALDLQGLRALGNVWVYGYNRAVGTTESYPAPATMGDNVSLQGTQVRYTAVRLGTSPSRGAADGYRVMLATGAVLQVPEKFDPTEVRALVDALS